MRKFELIAPTLFGLEGLAGDELRVGVGDLPHEQLTPIWRTLSRKTASSR